MRKPADYVKGNVVRHGRSLPCNRKGGELTLLERAPFVFS
jgi:hypothetical protein